MYLKVTATEFTLRRALQSLQKRRVESRPWRTVAMPFPASRSHRLIHEGKTGGKQEALINHNIGEVAHTATPCVQYEPSPNCIAQAVDSTEGERMRSRGHGHLKS